MDQAVHGDILSSAKDESVLGTYEPSAFLLSLRDRNEFTRLHPSGYHCIPHIGTYGQDYTLALPMILLSLPSTASYLQKLPRDVLGALDLEQYTTSSKTLHTIQTPPNTPLTATAPLWTRAQDVQLHTVARQLVWSALLNACSRVLNGSQHMDDIITQMESMSMDSKLQSDTLESDWSISHQNSSVSMDSCSPSTSSKKVSFHQPNGPFPSKLVMFPSATSLMDFSTDEEYEHEVSIVAKKLVNKTLHIACKRVESLYRRSSIEYLIASTKRMKIAQSPSPPPTLYEESGEDGRLNPFQLGRNRRSPSPDYLRLKRGKRQRSGSHDIAMQGDLDQKRPVGAWRSQNDCTEPRRILKGRSRGSGGIGSSQLTSVVSRMSTTEELPESDTESEEESYTVLSPIQVSPNPDIVKASHAHEMAHVGFSRLQSIENPETQTIPQVAAVDSVGQDDSVPDMDLLVIIHGTPTPKVCQKFLCESVNEVNLVYHCWLYRDSPFIPTMTLNGKLEMGVFCPNGVEPAHLDLQDAGVAFHMLEERTVCIHSCCFSPDNAQLQLVPTTTQQFHSFFSAARHGNRRVAAFHLIPASESVEETLRRTISNCHDLGQLLFSLKSVFPEMGERLAQLVLPSYS